MAMKVHSKQNGQGESNGRLALSTMTLSRIFPSAHSKNDEALALYAAHNHFQSSMQKACFIVRRQLG